MLFALALAMSLLQAETKAVPDFNHDIKPLFEEHCVKCHGPEKQKGGVRFDTRDGAFQPPIPARKLSCPATPSKAG